MANLKVGCCGLIILLVFSGMITPLPSLKAEQVSGNQDQIRAAAAYIAGRYDNRIGLVSESEDKGSNVPDHTPCYRTFWVYDDNLWAFEALSPFNLTLAENISKSLKPYIDEYGNSQLFEVVLGMKIPTPIHAHSSLKVATYTLDGTNYTVWADRHKPEDGGIFYDAEQYADLCFYLALNYYLDRNTLASERWFRTGEAFWNGHGFFDKAANESASQNVSKRYQNYKLGLYLFTANATGFNSSIYNAVEKTAWSYQEGNGGIAAQSYLNGTIYGTANVETTSILLLAYNEEAIARFTNTLKIGAYYYPWWGIPFNDHWDQGVKYTPLLGKYNSSDALVADKQIVLAMQHKIDFFAVSWIGKGDWLNWDYDDIDYNLRNGLLKANLLKNFNFCLFYETVLVLNSTIQLGKNFAEIFVEDMNYSLQYLTHPRYLRVNGDPVLFIYNVPFLYDHARDQNMTDQDVHRLFDYVRQLLAAKGVNLYIIGDLGGGPSPSPPDVNATWLYSMNATTSYFFFDPSKGWNGILNNATVYYPEWRTVMNSQGIGYVPDAYPGFDNTEHCKWENRSSEGVVLPLNEIMFKKMLDIAVNCSYNDPKIVMITSWNEWMESTSIEPSVEFGELFLHTVYDTVPEFPSGELLALFMITTALVAIVYRRKRQKWRQSTFRPYDKSAV